MLNKHSQLKFLLPPTSSHINDNNVYTGRCYTLGIASYQLPTLPSQNTLLDCLFLIHLSTILHPWTIHFKTKLRPKWPKKFFSFGTAPPLSQGLDDRLTPYLKVWIRYWFQLHRLSFPYDHEQCISYYRSFILPGLNGKNAWLRPWRFCHPSCKASGIFLRLNARIFKTVPLSSREKAKGRRVQSARQVWSRSEKGENGCHRLEQ